MKSKVISKLIVLLLVFTLIIPTYIQASSIWINETKLNLYIGEKCTLEVYGTNKTVTWSSADKTIAKVSKKGVITGVSNGKTKIKAKVGKKIYTCTVTVIDKAAYDITINATTITLTYTANFGFEELQPVITFYDKSKKELGNVEFTKHKAVRTNKEIIEEKNLPEFEYSYYEISFITK